MIWLFSCFTMMCICCAQPLSGCDVHRCLPRRPGGSTNEGRPCADSHIFCPAFTPAGRRGAYKTGASCPQSDQKSKWAWLEFNWKKQLADNFCNFFCRRVQLTLHLTAKKSVNLNGLELVTPVSYKRDRLSSENDPADYPPANCGHHRRLCLLLSGRHQSEEQARQICGQKESQSTAPAS